EISLSAGEGGIRYGRKTEIEFVYQVQGGGSRGVKLTIEPEFFTGERTLLEELGDSMSYTEKALSIVGGLLYPEEGAAALGSAKDYLEQVRGLWPEGVIDGNAVEAGLVRIRAFLKEEGREKTAEGLKTALWGSIQ